MDHKLDINDNVQIEEAVKMNGADLPDGKVVVDAPPSSTEATRLVDFILQQLQPPEQIGFLRGQIILIASRMGTPGQMPGDVQALADANLLFQTKLRTFTLAEEQRREDAQATERAYMLKADEDAQKRGFDSHAQMQAELQDLYKSVEERINLWHSTTEPGGDITSAPDTDALLFDVYRILNGVAQPRPLSEVN